MELQPLLDKAALLVNATPAGMFPAIDGNPLPQGVTLTAGMRVYDLVYNPPETQLVRQARRIRSYSSEWLWNADGAGCPGI